MPVEILMPALSPTMTEGNLVTWLKKEGDSVSAGDIIAEIETDKATMEVETVEDGVIGKILVAEGTENVPVNSLIALLIEEHERAADLDRYEGDASDEKAATESIEGDTDTAVADNVLVRVSPTVTSLLLQSGNGQNIKIKASPLARRIAQQKGIDLSSVRGSGPYGRIVKRDVEESTNEASAACPVSSSASTPAFRDEPVSRMRKIIAKRLLNSKQTVPHFYLTVDVLMDELLSIRKRLNEGLDNHKITVNDFVIRAAALALKALPEANASWLEDTIRYYTHSDISVAVSIDDGLITPILKSAETKSILDLSYEMKDLAFRAREGTLKPNEFQGGSFTISNLGMYGIKEFSAIINPPQACILAIGASRLQAIVEDGAVMSATVMSCTLSVDHRVVDGKIGADFIATFKKYIENPLLMMM